MTFWRLKSFNPTATFYLRWQTWWPLGIVIKSASGKKKLKTFNIQVHRELLQCLPVTSTATLYLKGSNNIAFFSFTMNIFLNIFIKNNPTFVTVIQRKTRDIIENLANRFSIYDSQTDSWINNKHVCLWIYGKYMVGNELLRCFSGDAFLFIDSIIFTVKEALQSGRMSKKTQFPSKCYLEQVIWA